jgi:diguanylate cyclase (GGDEF)-like protein
MHSGTSSPNVPHPPARILLAEDSRFLRRATELILTKSGYEVISAADGAETLNIARTASPNLIILDLMMPKMNGIEVLASLKQDPNTSAIPVVILSGLSRKNGSRLLKAGAAAYYEKTKLIPDALVHIVKSVLADPNALQPQHSASTGGSDGIEPEIANLYPPLTFPEEQDSHFKQKASDYENDLLDQIILLNNELATAQRALAKANEELRRVAETDALTELPTRRKAGEEIERLLALARRQHTSVCFAFLDLDNFKLVNDTYGHATGDKVLQRFGKFLATSVRTEDVVGRWGGEEFIVALYGCSVEHALMRLNEMLERFREERFTCDAGSFQVSFSGGVAVFPAAGSSLDPVYDAADRALYQAKRQGRNRIVAHTSGAQSPPEAHAIPADETATPRFGLPPPRL